MYRGWLKGSVFALAAGVLGVGTTLPITSAHADTPGVSAVATSSTGVVSPVHGSPTSSNSNSSTRLARGTRRVHSANGTRNSPPASPAAPGKSQSTSVLSNFNGVSSADSANVNFGAEFEPPDQGLCVGNGYVLEPVNSAYRVYTTNGHTLSGPSNVNDLFNQGALQFTSDPRCYYDASTNPWFATILFLATNSSGFGTTSDLLVAVNPSGNPLSAWTQYVIDTTDSKNKGCGAKLGGCFGDQPTLGIDQNNLYVTTNEFGITSNTANPAQIFAFAKSDLIAGGQVHYALFKNILNADRSPAYSVQPALSTGNTDAEYFLDSLDPNGTGDSRVGVWALTNGAAVASGGVPTLSTMIINSDPYAIPPAATQKGAASFIDSGDDRMQQTQFINGTIWGELDTALNIPGDSTTRAAAYWLAVQPSLASGLISGATIANQGYVAQAGNYVLYPAVQVDSTGNAAMVFSVTGANMYPSAAFASLAAGGSNFGAIRIAAGGTGPYDPTASRWGDYSFAVLDPTADAFWLSTEYIPAVSSQTPDRAANWGTRVFEVSAR